MPIKTSLFFIIIFFAVSVYAQAVFTAQKYKTDVDKRVTAAPEKMKYFVKLKGMEQPFKVPRPNYWPRDVEYSYSLFYDEKGNLVYAVKEQEPENTGGGWTLMYAYYFSPEGKTLAVHKYSTFFNRYCVGNEDITLSDIYYYDKDFAQLERKCSLTSESGRQLDSMQCETPYHFPYKFAPTRKAFLKESGFEK